MEIIAFGISPEVIGTVIEFMTLMYISTDLNTKSSGDMVASRELEAIQQLGKENNEDVIIFDFKDVHPIPNNLPDIPMLIDYFTMNKLLKMDLSKMKLVAFYGGSYSNTIQYLKSKGIKTSYSCMMHNRRISIEEHEKIYGPNSFPFKHITDNRLWKMYVIDAIQNADVVITPGKAPRDSLLEEGAKNVVCIPHGTMIPDENKMKPFPKQFRIGYLGAVGPDKGLIYLIQAWSRLNYQDSIIIFAGNQSQYLEPLIKKYGSNGGKYHLMGFVDNVADFYNNISLYIQPSATEGYGIETNEAMSYGRPVICSNNAGSADCITNGKDGFVVPAMNSDAISDKIQYFKDNPNEIIRMGKNARKKSLMCDWKIIKDKYIFVWKDLINRK